MAEQRAACRPEYKPDDWSIVLQHLGAKGQKHASGYQHIYRLACITKELPRNTVMVREAAGTACRSHAQENVVINVLLRAKESKPNQPPYVRVNNILH